jgi:hypothetical protein
VPFYHKSIKAALDRRHKPTAIAVDKAKRGVTPTPTEPKKAVTEHEKDLELALVLHQGQCLTENGRYVEGRYLSRHTKPTEKEGKKAVARALLVIAAKHDGDENLLLAELAQAYDPEAQIDQIRFGWPAEPRRRTVEFKGTSKGHSKRLDDFQIAWEVDRLCPNGKGKTEAVKAVAEDRGVEERVIWRVLSRVRRYHL